MCVCLRGLTGFETRKGYISTVVLTGCVLTRVPSTHVRPRVVGTTGADLCPRGSSEATDKTTSRGKEW